ncbi:MAG: DUF4386 family protein [Hydrogenophaga sp.]|nr:DUF4386 family protein [Hydrogenophaga sp.]
MSIFQPITWSLTLQPSTHYRSAGFLAIFHALLFFVPLGVLGAAIGWPANLDLPAAHNLPLVLSQSGPVKLGYSVYLLYSLLFFPVVLLISWALSGKGELPLLLKLAVGFALLSTLARCLGIVRWLTVMPVLATQYQSADAAGQAVIATVYTAFNAYAGGVGEILGVFLLSATSIALLAAAMWSTAGVPRWLAWMAWATSAGLLFLSLELFGLNLSAFIAPFSILYMVWMVALGVHLIRRARNARVLDTNPETSS